MFGHKKKPITIIAATRHPGALAELHRLLDVNLVEAVTTGGVYQRLSEGAALIVVDDEHLAENGLSREGLRAQIQAAGLLSISGAAFATHPDHWLGAAQAATGRLDSLPPRTVAIANVSGGVGKTTLCLHLARYCVDRLRLSALVVEVGLGASGLHALCDPSLPTFYEVITQDVEPGHWNGVRLIPMRWDTARLIGSPDLVQQKLERWRAAHVLTLFDANPASPLWPVVQDMAHEVLALSTSRPDALANALQLVQSSNGACPIRLVLNRQRKLSLADTLTALSLNPSTPLALQLPEVRDADRYSGELGEKTLRILYPYLRSATTRPAGRPGRNGKGSAGEALLVAYQQKKTELASVETELAEVEAQLTSLGWTKETHT